MKKTRLIVLLCALTAAAWSFPGLAHAKRAPKPSFTRAAAQFDGGAAFDGSAVFGGGAAFDGH